MTAATSLFAGRELIARAPRSEVNITVRIEGPTVQPFSSRVKNISSSGMLLVESSHLQVGDAIYATLPGKKAMLCFVARVKRGGGAGVKFDVEGLRDRFWEYSDEYAG